MHETMYSDEDVSDAESIFTAGSGVSAKTEATEVSHSELTTEMSRHGINDGHDRILRRSGLTWRGTVEKSELPPPENSWYANHLG